MEPVFSSRDLILTLALSFMAFAIAGATALAIFWPLSKVHLRDRHPDWRETHLAGSNEWAWFLKGRFASIKDPGLNGLARPLQISLWVIVFGLGGAWLLWLAAEYLPQ